jgi:hypothetical protein
MAELLILDFHGADEADYLKVNEELGLDPKTGAGDWPAGLIMHVAGVSDAGHGYVIRGLGVAAGPGRLHELTTGCGHGGRWHLGRPAGDLGTSDGSSEPRPLTRPLTTGSALGEARRRSGQLMSNSLPSGSFIPTA